MIIVDVGDPFADLRRHSLAAVSLSARFHLAIRDFVSVRREFARFRYSSAVVEYISEPRLCLAERTEAYRCDALHSAIFHRAAIPLTSALLTDSPPLCFPFLSGLLSAKFDYPGGARHFALTSPSRLSRCCGETRYSPLSLELRMSRPPFVYALHRFCQDIHLFDGYNTCATQTIKQSRS